MPEFYPITPIRYVVPEGGDLSTRISPPYDVLDALPKQALLSRDPHNIVAIDLPVTPPKTVGPDEAYASAGRLLSRWLSEGVLVVHDRPVVVCYEQVYTLHGETVRRRGLFGSLGLEPFNRKGGGIFRHERTIQGGLDDRYKLMEHTRMQLSPVFGVYSDDGGVVAGLQACHFDGREPDFFGTTGHDGVLHRCWLVEDEGTIGELQTFFSSTDVFIADGHHRYTTALNYAGRHADDPQSGRCLFMLVAIQDPGMMVLPTHRIVDGLEHGVSLARLKACVGRWEHLELVQTDHGPDGLADLERMMADDVSSHCYGIYDAVSGETGLLRVMADDPLSTLIPDRAPVWRKLDVAIAHELVIERLLRPAFGSDRSSYRYTADLVDFRRMSGETKGSIGLMLRPTPLESVCAVSKADELMPPKSTFFYPKVATGLVINPLNAATVMPRR